MTRYKGHYEFDNEDTALHGAVRYFDPADECLYDSPTSRASSSSYWSRACVARGRLYFESPSFNDGVFVVDEPTRALLNAYGYTWGSLKGVCPVSEDDGQRWKNDAGKLRYDLLVQDLAGALEGVADIMTFAVTPKEQGGKGYADNSWRDIPDIHRRLHAAINRHQAAIHKGEVNDSESGKPHTWHMAVSILILSQLDYEARQ